MDNNFIKIDDLVRQRLGGEQEQERAGAWMRMNDLLDQKMPVRPAGLYWRRMFSAVIALVLLSLLTAGGYELSSYLKKGAGDNGMVAAAAPVPAHNITNSTAPNSVDGAVPANSDNNTANNDNNNSEHNTSPVTANSNDKKSDDHKYTNTANNKNSDKKSVTEGGTAHASNANTGHVANATGKQYIVSNTNGNTLVNGTGGSGENQAVAGNSNGGSGTETGKSTATANANRTGAAVPGNNDTRGKGNKGTGPNSNSGDGAGDSGKQIAATGGNNGTTGNAATGIKATGTSKSNHKGKSSQNNASNGRDVAMTGTNNVGSVSGENNGNGKQDAAVNNYGSAAGTSAVAANNNNKEKRSTHNKQSVVTGGNNKGTDGGANTNTGKGSVAVNNNVTGADNAVAANNQSKNGKHHNNHGGHSEGSATAGNNTTPGGVAGADTKEHSLAANTNNAIAGLTGAKEVTTGNNNNAKVKGHKAPGSHGRQNAITANTNNVVAEDVSKTSGKEVAATGNNSTTDVAGSVTGKKPVTSKNGSKKNNGSNKEVNVFAANTSNIGNSEAGKKAGVAGNSTGADNNAAIEDAGKQITAVVKTNHKSRAGKSGAGKQLVGANNTDAPGVSNTTGASGKQIAGVNNTKHAKSTGADKGNNTGAPVLGSGAGVTNSNAVSKATGNANGAGKNEDHTAGDNAGGLDNGTGLTSVVKTGKKLNKTNGASEKTPAVTKQVGKKANAKNNTIGNATAVVAGDAQEGATAASGSGNATAAKGQSGNNGKSTNAGKLILGSHASGAKSVAAISAGKAIASNTSNSTGSGSNTGTKRGSGSGSGTSGNKANKSATTSNQVAENTDHKKMGKRTIEKLVLHEHFIKTSPFDGYYAIDTVSIGKYEEEYALANDAAGGMAAPAGRARRIFGPMPDPSYYGSSASASALASGSSTGKSSAGTLKETLSNKKSGAASMEKISAAFNDIKTHVGAVQFAPGLTAGINGTFFGPNSFKGFQFGVSGNFIFSENVSVMTELKYFHRINNDFTLDDNYYNYTPIASGGYNKQLVTNSYSFSALQGFEMPVAAAYHVGNFNFYLGGNFVYNFSINTGAGNPPSTDPSQTVSQIGDDNKPKLSISDFTSRFGIGYLFGMSFIVSPNVNIDLRNVQTLWDNSTSSGQKIISSDLYRSPSLQLSIGYRLGNKSSSKE